jgi:hypothetical protein
MTEFVKKLENNKFWMKYWGGIFRHKVLKLNFGENFETIIVEHKNLKIN